MYGRSARSARGYVRGMRPFPLIAALALALSAALLGALVSLEHWFGGHVVLAVVAYLAVATVAFNWGELYVTRHDR
jgi:hypothetical protein